MKAWTTTNTAGRCAYDFAHTWRAGARIFVVQGATWRKSYCSSCAALHQAPPDTGEILDMTDQPNYPAPLKAQAEAIAEKIAQMRQQPKRFDGRAAAARNDE